MLSSLPFGVNNRTKHGEKVRFSLDLINDHSFIRNCIQKFNRMIKGIRINWYPERLSVPYK